MKELLGLLTFCIVVFAAKSQTEVDAVRLSQRNLNGSARFVGLGGAMLATGGDLSTLSYNPAGLGILTKTDLSGSLAIDVFGSETSHYGNSVYDSDAKFSIDHIGIGGPSNVNTKGKWGGVNFGIAYTKQKSFNRTIDLEGVNTESTLLDAFYSLLNTNSGNYDFSNPPNAYPYSVDLAWNTLLVDTFNNQYYTQINTRETNQRKRISQSGSLNELNIGGAINYDHKVYLGASINLQSLEYFENNILIETVSENDTLTTLEDYSFEESLEITGSGVNLRVGAIFRVSDYLRLATSIQTPTLFNLTDQFDAIMVANYASATFEALPPSPLYFEYRFVGPWRLGFGGTALFGKSGHFAVDYEYIDNSIGSFGQKNQYPWNTQGVNNLIGNNLRASHNVRSGIEYRFGNIMVRGGFNWAQNPYKNNLTIKNGFRSTSFGGGYKSEGWYLDFVIQNTVFETFDYYLYNPSLANVQPTSISNRDLSVMFTFGIRY